MCTTYETVFHDTNRSATLQAVPWFRIVLDEGASLFDLLETHILNSVFLGKHITYEIAQRLFERS